MRLNAQLEPGIKGAGLHRVCPDKSSEIIFNHEHAEALVNADVLIRKLIFRGVQKAIGFFVGQVIMYRTQGKANPKLVNGLISKLLY